MNRNDFVVPLNMWKTTCGNMVCNCPYLLLFFIRIFCPFGWDRLVGEGQLFVVLSPFKGNCCNTQVLGSLDREQTAWLEKAVMGGQEIKSTLQTGEFGVLAVAIRCTCFGAVSYCSRPCLDWWLEWYWEFLKTILVGKKRLLENFGSVVYPRRLSFADVNYVVQK